MGKNTTTPQSGDLATLSQEELLAFAKDAQVKIAEQQEALKEGVVTIEQAEKKIKELEGKVGKFEKDLEEALGLNAELQASLDEKPVAGALPEVKHKGKTYQVMLPKFRYNREVYTAKDLEGNNELVGKLIDIESGVLKLKED